MPKKYAAKITDAGTPAYVGETDAAAANAVLTLVFDNGGELASVTTTANLEMYTAKYAQIENGALTWVYNNGTLSAIYQGGTNLESTDNDQTTRDAKLRDDIVVDIKLDNIGTGAQQWTVMNDSSNTGTQVLYYNSYTNGAYDTSNTATQLDSNRLWTFYYNDDVESGDTTSKLVDSVTLRETTKKDAFIAFDFDLNVNMESVQVTMDENGKEKTTPVNTWAATTVSSTAVNTGAKPSGNDDAATYTNNTEIATVGWIATT